MKKLLVLCATILSLTASADPECDFWRSEVSLIEARLIKVEVKLKQCATPRECKDLELLKESLEIQHESYLENSEIYCM